MTQNNNPIFSALNLPDMQSERVRDIVSTAHDDSAKTDFEMARSNIHEVIQNGNYAIEKLAQIADSSQHPRAFEVLSNMLTTLVNANKDLLELQTKIREINATDGKGPGGGPQVVNNNLFVGSTQELLKTLKNMNAKPVDD